MATIRKNKNGYRVEIYRNGVRRSKVLPTKRACEDWANRTIYEIDNGEILAVRVPFGEVLQRYAREVSPSKRGARWEMIRLEMMCRDPIALIPIGELSAGDLASWRDRRSAEVGANSVLREISLLSAVLTQARREWGLIATNPMSDVRKPKKPAPRDRLPQPDELERLAHAAGDDLTTATARAFHAFRFASETAMRAGEIVGLTRDNLDMDNRVAHLPMTKNGHARDVPLSSAAVDLIGQLPPDLDPVFGLTSRQLDVLFRKIKSRALVDGLTFHDSRAAALTMLSRKVDVMTLAKISGHRDLRILQNVYYRETAADIAARLG